MVEVAVEVKLVEMAEQQQLVGVETLELELLWGPRKLEKRSFVWIRE